MKRRLLMHMYISLDVSSMVKTRCLLVVCRQEESLS